MYLCGKLYQGCGAENFYEKLRRFENLIALNERAKTNTLHISLNFDAADKLDKEKLVEIANVYMGKIGFKDQPYLVYQHHDSGHQHIHLLTTNIREDGKRIDTFNIGRNQSEKARKEIENEYGLVKAESKKETWQEKQEALKVQYGKTETKRAITNVLDKVINQYRYTSLAELNAVLQRYNVIADRGKPGSCTYEKGGLVYRALDENGQKVGAPIKASDIYSKPTLPVIEAKFAANEKARKTDASHLKTAIDWALTGKLNSLADFSTALEKERIQMIIRRSETGQVYGLTYIDHTRKNVFNGSDLGKEYSAKRILERLNISLEKEVAVLRETQHNKAQPATIAKSKNSSATNKPPGNSQKNNASKSSLPIIKDQPGDSIASKEFNRQSSNGLSGKSLAEMIEQLAQPEESFERLPYELREEEKRKRKRPEQDHSIER